MSGPPVADGDLRRLHPATVVVRIPGALRSLALPLVAIYFFSTPGDSDLLVYVAIGAALSVVASALRYAFTRYGITADDLVIRTGAIFRRNRTIPLERIQNIDLLRTPVHRLLGVAEVRVETAGAEGSEAHLSVVGLTDAEIFRSELLERAGRRAPGRTEAPADVLRASSLRELLLAGATENRVGVIIGLLFGLVEFAGDGALERLETTVEERAGELVGTDWSSQLLLALAVGAAFVLAGWLVSITLTVVRYHGFALVRRGAELRCRYGLLTRHEAVVPLLRLQVLRLEANVLRRALGLVTVAADTAGSVEGKEQAGAVTLSPLLSRPDAARLAHEVLPRLDLGSAHYERVHALSIRRGFVRFALLGALVLAPLALALELPAAWLGALAPAWLLAAWGLARWRYAALGWLRAGPFLLARAGMWTRREWVVPEEKVQTVSVTSSPFQRRLGLATLHVVTAGAGERSNAVVVDLAAGLAERLRDELSVASNASGLLRGGI